MLTTTNTQSATSRRFAVCGNPNCGKTTIFNYITGLNQQVGNYPGVTVERVAGLFYSEKSKSSQKYSLIDVPGTYSLSAFTPDEYIAACALCGEIQGEESPEVIIAVLDATNLERSLYLLLQVMQTGIPIVIGLNMVDLAKKRGITIDIDKLSQVLGGIPVVEVVGNKGIGINELKEQAISQLDKKPAYDNKLFHPVVEDFLQAMHRKKNGISRSRALLIRVLFDINGPAENKFLKEESPDTIEILQQSRKKIIAEFGKLSYAETNALTKRSEEIFLSVVQNDLTKSNTNSSKIDKYLLHPVLGPVILLLMMHFVFQSIFSWAAPFMDMIDSLFGMLSGVVEANMTEGPLRSLITDGIIGGVGSVLIFIPQIAILFLFIALLEDSGYMPRAAFLVDRMFRWCGLSGKSFIPMLSSFACAIPGIMATRTIEDKKLRIMTILVAPLMTCSARLPVYAIMIAAFVPYKVYFGIFNLQGLTLTLLYLLGVVVAILVSFVLKKTVFKTEKGSFMMELPSYKIPTVKSIFIRVYNRSKHFIIRAGTVIMAITIIIWALSYYPRADLSLLNLDASRTAIEEQMESEQNAIDKRLAASLINLDDASVIRFENIKTVLDTVTSKETLETVRNDFLTTASDFESLIILYSYKQELQYQAADKIVALQNEAAGFQIRNSYLGKMGRSIEPLFKPLGWDWKITMSVLASFPAREVIIAVLGTIYNLGENVDEESSSLIEKMQTATWDDGDKIGQPVFTVAVAISIMVFFALCCQCGATLVTIKQETTKWSYAVAVFTYMTTLAYIMAFVSYQFFTFLGL